MAETRTRNTGRVVAAALAAVCLLCLPLGLLGCFSGTVVVRTARATHADLITPLSTNGKVQALEDFQAHAGNAGTVEAVPVEVGSHVRAGQLLVQLDASDARHQIASAQANLVSAQNSLANMSAGGSLDERTGTANEVASARSQLASAAASLTALQRLQGTGAASANEVAQAQQRVNDAQAHLTQVQARDSSRYSRGDLSAQQVQVSGARAALASARDGLNGVLIRAPFSGTVYNIEVSRYDYVQAGGELLDMADLHKLQVHAYFDEPEVGKLQRGQPVKIVWDARPDSVWHGHIELPPTTIKNYGTRNVGECIIAVDDPDGQLLPNTNVTVTVTVSQKFGVLTVPREALHTEGSQDFVYLIAGNMLERRPVEVGSLNLTRVEIASGLKDGDLVALNAVNNADLQAGMKVQVEK